MILQNFDRNRQQQFLENSISQWGWSIFPLHKVRRGILSSRAWCSCKLGHTCPRVGKCPRICWGDHKDHVRAGRVGHWLDNSFRNFGVHLGLSNLIVIDVDPRNGGEEFIRQTRTREGSEITNWSEASNGGYHLYFRAGGYADPLRGLILDDDDYTTCLELMPGAEVLSGQHFVVAPYSEHRSGAVYIPHFDRGFLSFGAVSDVVKMD